MKTLVHLYLALLVSSVDAAEIPELSFGSAHIEASPLSLLEGAKQRLPPVFNDSEKRTAAVRRALVSRMPIIAPQPGVDFRLRVKTPDPTVDYELLVKEPAVEPEK